MTVMSIQSPVVPRGIDLIDLYTGPQWDDPGAI
jgi:hypothetical protein